jgi:branched-chain amino acid transport system permease protein
MDSLQLLVSGVANGCIYGLVALGFVLIYKASESVNFAQGDMMILGAFLAIALINTAQADLPFLVGLAIAAITLGVFGYLLDCLLLRRVFGQPQLTMVVLTIAIGFLLRFFIGAIFGHDPAGLEVPVAGQSMQFGGLSVPVIDAIIIATTVGLVALLWLFFARTRLGLAMQASSQNQMAAYYMGIPVKRVVSLVWAMSGIVAAIAGVLFAAKGAVEPSAGLVFGIKAFAAAVIGGLGSLPGALAGGLLIGVMEPFAGRHLPSGLAQVSPYVLMLLVLIFRPSGLFAQVHAKKV